MLLSALLTSAVAIAVEIPDRPAPESDSARLAIVMGDGEVVVIRDHDDAGIVAARCPAPRASIEDIAGVSRAYSIEDELDAESEPWSAASVSPSTAATSMAAESLTEEELPGPHACDEPRSAAQVAWFGGALYLACTGGSLHRWREDTGLLPVVPAPPAEPDSSSLGPPIVPERIVAMSGGAQLWLVDAGDTLWVSRDAERFRPLGPVPEPALAVAEWNGAIVAAGATAVWRRADIDPSWQPIQTIPACALAAHEDALWLAGPAGLVELSRDRARVHLVAPLTGAAARDGTIWLASGQGPVVRASLEAVASVLVPGARGQTPGDDSTSAGVTAGRLQRARVRARRARFLPEVTAHVRWARVRNLRAMSEPPWSEPVAAARSHALVFLVWLTWSLGDSGAAFGTATRSWP